MSDGKLVWRIMHPDGSRTVVGDYMLALAYARGDKSHIEEISLNLKPTPVVRELKVLRGMASNLGDDDKIQEAEIDAARLQHIESAARLALGILWMDGRGSAKVEAAFKTLRNALGGKKALGEAIADAIESGYEADHPEDATWWAGKKDGADG